MTATKLIRPIVANGKMSLADIETDSTCGYKGDKDSASLKQLSLTSELAELQTRLYAEGKHRILVVLQAMDTGGKDGAIRKVFGGVNPQGVRVTSFKAPTAHELARDYLWRVHQHVPAKGEIAIFNRSHYEDVLITRVHDLIDTPTAKRRFRQINDFEAMLVEEGTLVLKFFLHISKEEQRERLQARLVDPTKQWKFNLGDVDERAHWDEYQKVYEQAINATSSPHAPWFIVPADRKWVRDLYISSVIVRALNDLDIRYPDPEPGLDKVVIT